MVHPDTEVRFINDLIGYGVFATRDIPMGTIVYARDALEIELDQDAFERLDPEIKCYADKYAYMDACGIRVISWDHAKLVNHSCQCNSMATAYGIEIAIKDIRAGEEITDDYGMFNVEEEMELGCCCTECRKVLRPDDLDRYHETWDRQVRAALERGKDVAQPLLAFLRPEFRNRVRSFWDGSSEYISVLETRCVLPESMMEEHSTLSGETTVD